MKIRTLLVIATLTIPMVFSACGGEATGTPLVGGNTQKTSTAPKSNGLADLAAPAATTTPPTNSSVPPTPIKEGSTVLDGKTFLAENAKKTGVVVLPSGLQYKIVKAGTGAIPKATDTVTTHYTGTLIDGTVFDSSVQRGQPASFPVNGVIKGWQEALQLMPVGSKWQLYIPSDLAYGSRGAGGVIGPNSTLVFDIELISID